LHRRSFAPVYLSEPDAQMEMLLDEFAPLDDVEAELMEEARA